MSVDQYLALDEDDIRYMVSINYGSTASSPWCGSAVKKPTKVRISDEDEDLEVTKGMSQEEKDLDEENWDVPVNDAEAPDSGE